MKTVMIGGVEVPMLANAATSMVHQRIFGGEDILIEYNKLFAGKTEKELEDTELNLKATGLIKRMGYTMAMQAKHVGKEEKLLLLGEGNFIKWISQFEDPYALEQAAADIMAVYSGEDAPTAEPKKEAAPQTDH